jgi:hypothetical protein
MGCNLALQPPEKVVEPSIIAVPRHQERGQPAHAHGSSFRERSCNR